MKNKPTLYTTDDHKRSGFWFGFALGVSTASSAIFFLGTKKGRETLKKVLDASEGLDEVLFEKIKEFGVEALHEVNERITPKIKRTFTALEESKSS